MALGLTRISGPSTIGSRWENVFTVAFDSSYPTGGEPLTRQDLGFAATVDPEFDVRVQSKGGYVFEYDHTNQKLLAYRQKDPAAAGGADITLPEVGNTTDLSAVTGVRIAARGRFLQ